ncbi:MAG TPA: hypothetical protein VK858_17100 [Longimicrobiales bacterium]|nr:hypothetical protein [Longimicrobiales bacterium]
MGPSSRRIHRGWAVILGTLPLVIWLLPVVPESIASPTRFSGPVPAAASSSPNPDSLGVALPRALIAIDPAVGDLFEPTTDRRDEDVGRTGRAPWCLDGSWSGATGCTP